MKGLDQIELKIHHSSNEISEINSIIRRCNEIIDSKSDENFSKRTKLKVLVSKDNSVIRDSVRGFTDYNEVEISLTKEDVLDIAKMLISKKEARKDSIIKELSKIVDYP